MASGGSPEQVVSDEDAEDWVPMPTHLRNSRKTPTATTPEASTAAPRDTRDTREKVLPPKFGGPTQSQSAFGCRIGVSRLRDCELGGTVWGLRSELGRGTTASRS